MTVTKNIGLFLGSYVHDVASGTRITLPSRFKVEITNRQMVMIQAKEGCLLCFDAEHFVKNSQKFMEQSSLEESGRTPRREIFWKAITVDIDANGRFVIPESLRNWAGIGKKAVLAGIGDSFEIWPLEKFPDQSALALGQV